MSLSTLLVSEVEEMSSRIESLLAQSNDLEFARLSSRKSAREDITATNPRVIWITLSPEPENGLALLDSLRSEFEDKHFLVSNETLEADLVKRSMQLGAVDFLDAKTWYVQLPDVTSRVMAKELSIQKEIKRQEKIKELLEKQKSPRASNPGLRSIRQKTGEIEMAAPSSAGTIAGVLILLLLLAGLFFMMPH